MIRRNGAKWLLLCVVCNCTPPILPFPLPPSTPEKKCISAYSRQFGATNSILGGRHRACNGSLSSLSVSKMTMYRAEMIVYRSHNWQVTSARVKQSTCDPLAFPEAPPPLSPNSHPAPIPLLSVPAID